VNRPAGPEAFAQGERVYRNAGNPPLVDLVDPSALVVLDVGCGAGDNAALLRARNPRVRIHGITRSEAEAALARERMESCTVADVEGGIPEGVAGRAYDAILFSHVLEHLRDPAGVLARFAGLLAPGGAAVVAVPNVLHWPQRIRFLLGDFEYEAAGVLDDSHLRFFTYRTAARLLLSKSPGLELAAERVTGSVPLWWLRRHVLPKGWSGRIDALGCRLLPNLFGGQVLLKAVKTNRPGTPADEG
jgi:SAM-dependent methyltransferase